MDRIASGRIIIFHLFELAEEVALDQLRQIWTDSTVGQLVPRRQTPDAIQFSVPPVVLPLGARPLTSKWSGAVRAKVFDFGVVSISWEIQAPHTWPELIEICAELQEDQDLESGSRRVLDEIRERMGPACQDLIPDSRLVEDYFVVYVDRFEAGVSGEDILNRHGTDLALVLRGERADLSADERRDALRLRHSYRENDLVVVTYSASFIYDTEDSTEHVDILEFANAQLLDLRYYDILMDRELERIHDSLQHQAPGILARGRLLKTTQHLNRLMIEVNDLREKIRNALKLVGEMYSARIYRMISDTMRLERWDQAVGDKLGIAQQIYHVLIDELNHQRSTILEVMIILLIALEIILLFIPGVRH